MNNKFTYLLILLISFLGIGFCVQAKSENTPSKFKGNTNIEFPKYIFSKIDKSKYQKTRTFFLELTTNEKGKIIDVKLKNGQLDEAKEIINIVRKMPKWSPAKNNGKKIISTFIVPLSFD